MAALAISFPSTRVDYSLLYHDELLHCMQLALVGQFKIRMLIMNGQQRYIA